MMTIVTDTKQRKRSKRAGKERLNREKTILNS